MADFNPVWITAGSSVVQAAMVIATGWIAIAGINRWRKVSIGKRRQEIAEKALVAAYHVQEALQSVRSPLGYTSEGQTRIKDEKEDPEVSRLLNTAFAPIERLNKFQDEFSELAKARLLCKAYFGVTASKPFDELFDVRHEIYVAAQMLASSAKSRVYGSFKDHDQFREWNEVIYWHGGKDKIVPKMEAAISSIEKVMVPYISDQRTIAQ